MKRTARSGIDPSTSGSIDWSPALIVSLSALVIGGGVLAATLPGLTSAVMLPRAGSEGTDGLAALLEEHDEAATLAVERFRGRSIFYPPPPPPRPVVRPPAPPPLPPPPPVDRPPPGPPPPPASYTGRKPSFVVGSTVYFDQGLRISVGEEVEGIRVISADPYIVRLGFQRGEYDVPLFDLGNALAPAMTLDMGAPGTPWLIPTESTTNPFTGMAAPAATPAAPAAGRPPGRAGARPAVPAPPPRVDPPATSDPELAEANPGGRPPVAIPAPLTDAQIDSMERTDALRAVTEITRALNGDNLDEATQQRLNEELDKLKKKLSPPE
ncbi:MAG TPA: hypothetical protein PKC43_02965 [Phycisphaerales bacterium]|nr:hypothetical protein [Phycisphaerales bacterium]HMP36388.1 hypothetical protein [Phycisphaerales bacterium]